ncbi:hypothetical protein HDU76_003218 [Blyttiomyces sp. JEL0837]|nr:hypothetical protein HDU76_003218 [Blyttiomyces sp. JEL0837]
MIAPDLFARFFELHHDLLQFSPISFLTGDYWDNALPKEWTKDLEHEPIESSFKMIKEGLCKSGWSQSLQSHVTSSSNLSSLPQSSQDKGILQSSQESIPELLPHLAKDMTPSKQIQVQRLAKLISDISVETGCSNVLDVGCGQGFLACVLAYQYNLNVFAIDFDGRELVNGESRLELVHQNHRKYVETTKSEDLYGSIGCVEFIEMNLDALTPEALDRLLQENDGATSIRDGVLESSDTGRPGWIVCSIESCGNLSNMAINLYMKSKSARGLVQIGCCYYLLNSSTNTSTNDFPSSQKYKTSNANLSHEISSVASQLKDWRSLISTQEQFQEKGDRMFARSVLECIRRDHGVAKAGQVHQDIDGIDVESALLGEKLSDGCNSNCNQQTTTTATTKIDDPEVQIEKLPASLLRSPIEYTRAALKCFYNNDRSDMVSDTEIEGTFLWHDSSRNKIAAAYALKMLIAPVAEMYILLDRVALLEEMRESDDRVTVEFGSIYDTSVHVRNKLIVSVKKE